MIITEHYIGRTIKKIEYDTEDPEVVTIYFTDETAMEIAAHANLDSHLSALGIHPANTQSFIAANSKQSSQSSKTL